MLAFLPFTNRKKFIEQISNRHQPEFLIDKPYIEIKECENNDINNEKEDVEEEKTSNLTKLLLDASNNQNILLNTTTETVTERTIRTTTTTCTTINNNIEQDTNTNYVPSTCTSTGSAASSLSSTYSLNSSETTKSSSSDNVDCVDAVKQLKTKNSNNHVAKLSTLAKNVAAKRKKQEQQTFYKKTPTTTQISTNHAVVSIKHSNRIPSDVLDDLAARFVINVPDIELSNLIRVCFQIELAHWFYLDFFCSTISKHQQNQQNRSERKKQQQLKEEEEKLKILDSKTENTIVEVIKTATPPTNATIILDTCNTDDETHKLQPCGIKYFALQLFEHIPFLRKHSASVEKILDDWKNYKLSVPTFGAILISEDLNYCLLVQSYFAKSSWGFPKGKVNENEDPVHCATREVYEETGYDISNIIDPNDYIESVINYQYTRLYLVHNVSLNTQFAPRTRYEIRCCDWFPIDSLPVNKSDAISKSKLGIKTNSFFMIMPFVKRLKRWVNDKRNTIESAGGLVANTESLATTTTTTTTATETKTTITTPNLLFSNKTDPFAIPSPIVRLSSTTILTATTPNRKLINNNISNMANNRRRFNTTNNGTKSPDNYTPSALLLSSGKLLKIGNNVRSDEVTTTATTSIATTTTSTIATTTKKRQKAKDSKQINEVKRKNSIKHSNSAAKLPEKLENQHKRERHKSMGDLDAPTVACQAATTPATPLPGKMFTKSKRQLFQSCSVNETIYNGIKKTQMLKTGYDFLESVTSPMKEFKNKIILDVNTIESQMASSPKIEPDLECRQESFYQSKYAHEMQANKVSAANNIELPFKSLSARCTPVVGLNECLATTANYIQYQETIKTSPKCATPPISGEGLLAVALAAANHNNDNHKLQQPKMQLLKNSYNTKTMSSISSSSSSSTISSDTSTTSATTSSYAASPIHMQQQQQQQQIYSFIKHPNSIMPLPTTIRSPITIVSELEAIALERAKTKALQDRASTPSAFSKAATQWTNSIVNHSNNMESQQEQKINGHEMVVEKENGNGNGNGNANENVKGKVNMIKISAWQDFSFSTNFLQDLFH